MVSHRIPYVLLVLCVLFSLPVGAGVSMNDASSLSPYTNEQAVAMQSLGTSESIANYSLKQLTASDQHSITSIPVDVGASVAMEYQETQTEFKLHALEHEFTGTDSSGSVGSLSETATVIEERALLLETREQQTRNEFLTDEISTRQYLREISFIASEAKLLEAFIADLEPMVENTENQEQISSQLATANGVIKGLYGPVRDQIINHHRGRSSPRPVFVSVEPSGVLLATIQGDKFERELYRSSDRSNGESSDVGLIEAVSQFQDEYPGVADAESGMDIGSVGASDREIITFRIQLPEGEMLLFYEQSTEKFYYESSNWALDRVNLEPGVLRMEESTRIVVNQSVVGGPLRVAVQNDETEEAIPATIEIGDSQVVRTGPDGTAWGIVPPGEYRIIVETATDATVTIPSSAFADS